MASYAFPLAPHSGFGSSWYSDLGPSLFNALQAGFKTENDLYDLQNRVRTDPYTVPAQAAQADAARLGADRSAMMTQGDIDVLNQLYGQRVSPAASLGVDMPVTPMDTGPVMSALGASPGATAPSTEAPQEKQDLYNNWWGY